MNLGELRSSIIGKESQTPWIFTGVEVGIMEIYIQQISKVFGAEIKRVNSLKEALAGSQQNTLFGSVRKLFIVKDDKEFMNDSDCWGGISSKVGDALIILVYSEIDGRSKMSKVFENQIVEFKTLDAKQLAKYIIKDTGLEAGRAEQMAVNCGLDYLTIKMESDKLLNFLEMNKLPINSAFDQALKQRILWIRWEDLFNGLIEAVMERKIGLAIERWKWLKELGESEMKALAFIYTQFKNLLLMFSGEGINPYFASQLQKAKQAFTREEVEDIVHIIQKSEQDSKMGRLEMGILLDYILVNIG